MGRGIPEGDWWYPYCSVGVRWTHSQDCHSHCQAMEGDHTMYGVEITTREDTMTYRIGSSVPPTEEWLETLVRLGSGYIANPLKHLFAPHTHQTVSVSYPSNVPTAISICLLTLMGSTNPSSRPLVFNMTPPLGTLLSSSIPLNFVFIYQPDQGFCQGKGLFQCGQGQ